VFARIHLGEIAATKSIRSGQPPARQGQRTLPSRRSPAGSAETSIPRCYRGRSALGAVRAMNEIHDWLGAISLRAICWRIRGERHRHESARAGRRSDAQGHRCLKRRSSERAGPPRGSLRSRGALPSGRGAVVEPTLPIASVKGAASACWLAHSKLTFCAVQYATSTWRRRSRSKSRADCRGRARSASI